MKFLIILIRKVSYGKFETNIILIFYLFQRYNTSSYLLQVRIKTIKIPKFKLKCPETENKLKKKNVNIFELISKYI